MVRTDRQRLESFLNGMFRTWSIEGLDNLVLYATARAWEQNHEPDVVEELKVLMLNYICDLDFGDRPNPWARFAVVEPNEQTQDRLLAAWILKELADASE